MLFNFLAFQDGGSFGEAIAKVFALIAQAAIFVIIAIALVVILVIVLIVKAVKKRKKRKKEQLTQTQETKDGRYSLKYDLEPQQPDGQSNASFVKEDVIVSKGQTVVAGKNNDIAVGRYTVLTTIDGVNSFNVRINGFVREVEHNTVIILGEGDSVTPVSHSIILR